MAKSSRTIAFKMKSERLEIHIGEKVLSELSTSVIRHAEQKLFAADVANAAASDNLAKCLPAVLEHLPRRPRRYLVRQLGKRAVNYLLRNSNAKFSKTQISRLAFRLAREFFVAVKFMTKPEACLSRSMRDAFRRLSKGLTQLGPANFRKVMLEPAINVLALCLSPAADCTDCAACDVCPDCGSACCPVHCLCTSGRSNKRRGV